MKQPWFRPVFVCGQCGFESFNPNDIREQYCGRCKMFVGEPDTIERFLEAPSPYSTLPKPRVS